MERASASGSGSGTEDRRLDALHGLAVLDTLPEPVFESITAAAAQACGASIALVSLVDADRQWFKSNIGLQGVEQMPREEAFCDHAIRGDRVFEVGDAASDPRFAAHPLVCGEPSIRFYAGAPIVMAGGERVGTVCVLDRSPRQLSQVQRDSLQGLSRIASTCLAERKRHLDTTRELAASEGRYRAIVEDQAELISLANRDGTLTYVNAAYARHFGLQPGQMVGRNLLDFVEESDRVAVQAHLEAVCSTKSPASGVNRMTSASGQTRWVAWSNRPLLDARGDAVSIQSVGRDITEQRLAEQALAESEQRNRHLYEGTPAVLHSIDAQGRLLNVSDRWLQLLGYERSEVIGRPSVDFLTPASQRLAREQVLPDFYRTGRCDNIEYQFVRKDGTVIDVLLSGILERDEQALPVRSLAVLEDMTERKHMAAELGRTHAHLDAIVDNVPVMLGYWDADRITRFANREFQAAVGLPPESMIGHPLSELYAAIDPTSYESAVAHIDAVLNGQRQEFECAMLTTLGLRQLRVSFVPDQSEPGRIVGFYGMWHDITGLKVLELRLRAELERRFASESRLRLVTDNVPALISYLDLEQRFCFVNKAYQEWFGVEPEQLIGVSLREFYGDAVHARIRPHFEAAAAGSEVSYEREMTGAGARSYVHVTMIPHRDEHGVVSGVYTLINDISARRKAEQALRRSEERLRMVTNNVPALISYWDRHGFNRLANQRYEALVNAEPGGLLGLHVAHPRAGLDPGWHRRNRDRIAGVLGGISQNYEDLAEAGDAGRYWQVAMVPDVQADGAVAGFYVHAFDITDRKQLEQRSAESERFLRHVTDNLPARIAYVDRDLRYRFVNEAHCRQSGRARDDIIGRTRLELPGAASDAAVAAHVDAVLRGEVQQFEYEETCNGQPCVIESHLIPDWAADGSVRGFFSTGTDVTERNRQQQVVHAALQEKETLLQEVYHRVKNNLQVVQSLLSLRRRSLADGVERAAIDDSIQRVRAMALVHEKLYQSGNLAAVSLADYTGDLLRQLDEAAGARGRGIALRQKIDVIETGLDAAVPFGLLLCELVTNSLKHAFPDDGPGEICVTLSRHGPNGAELTVSDNGVGLPPGKNPFDNRSMGLKLASSLARQLGGELQVRPAAGAIFATVVPRI